MAVRFALPSDRPVGLVGFAWSPLLEAALSLRAVVHPKRFPMHLPWARRCRELPPDLLDEIRALTHGFPDFLPGVFEVGLAGDLPSFDDELDRFAALDDETWAWELSLGYGGTECGASPEERAIIHDPDYQQRVVATAAARDADHADAVAMAFHDPARSRARMTSMLRRYWDEAFHEEWDRIRPRIEGEVTLGARALVTRGVGGLVDELLPEGHWDADRSHLVVDKHWEHTCDVVDRGGLLMVPTVFGWPCVLIELGHPWPASIMFPLRDLRQPEVPQAADHEVADGLRALGDETRLQITRLVAEQPRSTRELATLLSLSESAVSRHLKTLAGAGIVDSERDGYFVLYRLVPDRIGALGGALRRTLGLAQAAVGPTPQLPVSLARVTDG